MSVRKIINVLEEKKQRIISIQDSITNIYNKYKKYKNFAIDDTDLISFKTPLVTKESKITSKLLNRIIYFLTIGIKFQEEFDESYVICSISFGDKEFPSDYCIKSYYGSDITIKFKTNEKHENLINAIDYFIGEMQNYVSNINIPKDKYIEIFSDVCEQSWFSERTKKKYKSEFKKQINTNNFDVLTIDNLERYIDFIIEFKKINEYTLWAFLNTILFNNINKIVEEKLILEQIL